MIKNMLFLVVFGGLICSAQAGLTKAQKDKIICKLKKSRGKPLPQALCKPLKRQRAKK